MDSRLRWRWRHDLGSWHHVLPTLFVDGPAAPDAKGASLVGGVQLVVAAYAPRVVRDCSESL